MKTNKQKTKKLKTVAPPKMVESDKYSELAAEVLESECRAVSSAASRRSATKPRFDVEKLKMQFCSGKQAERIARNAVLRTLKRRADAEGIRFNAKGRIGPEIASIAWLYPQLKHMENIFAAQIDEELDELGKPGARREILVGRIYSQILCIRATITPLPGWEEKTT